GRRRRPDAKHVFGIASPRHRSWVPAAVLSSCLSMSSPQYISASRLLTPVSWLAFASGAVDRVAAPIGFTLNGEMSQNTARAGLLSRDTQMRELDKVLGNFTVCGVRGRGVAPPPNPTPTNRTVKREPSVRNLVLAGDSP